VACFWERFLSGITEYYKKDKELEEKGGFALGVIERLRKRLAMALSPSALRDEKHSRESEGLEKHHSDYKVDTALAFSRFLREYLKDKPEEAVQLMIELEKSSREQAQGIMALLAQSSMASKKLDRIEDAVIGSEDVAVSESLLAQLRELRGSLKGLRELPRVTPRDVKKVEVQLSTIEERVEALPLWARALKAIQEKKGEIATSEHLCSVLGKDYSRNSDRKQVYNALKHLENDAALGVEVIRKGREKVYRAQLQKQARVESEELI